MTSAISNNQSPSLIDEETSHRITSLRFLLSVLVVFIHNNYTSVNISDMVSDGIIPPVFVQNAAGEWIQFIISSGIASCAVPLFFMFSAYLFFKKPQPFSVMVQKKLKSLAIPYCIWIALNILLISLGKILVVKINPAFLGIPDNIPLLTWNFLDYLKAFSGFGFDKYNHPYVGQFWFVRDLFILFLISPLLRFIYKKFPKSSLILSIFIYISDISPDGFSSDSTAILFFTLGYFWAEKDFSPFTLADSFHWYELITIFIFSLLCDKIFFPGTSICSALVVLFSCLIFLKLSAPISKKQKTFKLAKKLAPFSFFLFAIHMPFLLSIIQKLWLHFLPMKNPFFTLLEYFGVNIVIILTGILIGIIIRKICPPVFRILNGGRG